MEMFTNMIPLTVDEIASDFLSNLHEEDIAAFYGLGDSGRLIVLHGMMWGVGMHIRNHYHLWEHPWTPELVDGIDCSPNHPDAISMRVLEKVVLKIKTCLGE